MSFVLERAPQTDDELYWAVRAMWGVSLPRHTCGNIEHTAPFTAFADAYFERGHSTVLWHGSRGLSGKSYMLSVLGITKAFLKGADVNMLGGSLAQSTNIHEHMRTAMFNKDAPRYMIEKEGNNLIKLTNNARIRPLTASQKTVRGPHPPFLILDEIDEMDIDILDAALGQPMPQINYLGEEIKPFTVMCSTWQNPEGCMVLNTPVATKRGEIPIQEVIPGDKVMTRDGWRDVTNSINTGNQECVTIRFASGRVITCTPWHPIWTSTGWVKASVIAVGAHVVSVIRGVGSLEASVALVPTDTAGALSSVAFPALDVNNSVVQSQIVPVVADGLRNLDRQSSDVVLACSDRLQMSGVDTSPIAASVVQRKIASDRTDNLHIDPSMRQEGSLPRNEVPVGLVAIPIGSDAEGPQDALVGVEIDGYIFAKDEVVEVTHSGIILPTWDLTVGDTHEYVANGILVHNTFTAIRRRFEDRGLPIVTWCYACSANPIDGWLSQETIEAKRLEIPAEMWRTEYELGEPAIGNRAFDPDAVEHVFNYPMEPIKEKIQKDFEEYTFEEPVKAGVYVAGADWGKEQDYTVISVMRADVQPAKLVYWMRVNRRPYPQMIGWFNKAINKYDCMAIHDGTGLGNVVNDYVDLRAQSFIMSGASRDGMLSEYVSAVENGRVQFPKFKTNYLAHKYARVGDIYGRGKDFHLPDEICSLALAWRLVKKHGFAGGDAVTIARDMSPTRSEAHFLPEPSNSDLVSGNKAVSVYVKNQKDEISLMA